MKNLLFALITILSTLSIAQDFRDNRELVDFFEQQTGAFKVKIVPAAKSIKVYVVGYESAKLTFTDLGLEASAIIAGNEKKLIVKKENSYFKIDTETRHPMQLDLKLKGKEEVNKLRFDIP